MLFFLLSCAFFYFKEKEKYFFLYKYFQTSNNFIKEMSEQSGQQHYPQIWMPQQQQQQQQQPYPSRLPPLYSEKSTTQSSANQSQPISAYNTNRVQPYPNTFPSRQHTHPNPALMASPPKDYLGWSITNTVCAVLFTLWAYVLKFFKLRINFERF